jgi:DNA-binding NarL/FixJ family response regulator
MTANSTAYAMPLDGGAASPSNIRVLVADDHGVVLRGMCELIDSSPHCEVVATATTGQEAAAKVRQFRPDVAVLDINMPVLNGIEATCKIHSEVPETAVLILTAYDSEQLANATLRAGARGYVLKSDAAVDLVRAVESLGQGRPFFSTPLAQMVLNGYLEAQNRQGPDAAMGLTPIERQIIQLLAEGYSNKEVAVRQGITPKTAETHHANIMRKLGLKSMSDIVHFAVRNRIIEA